MMNGKYTLIQSVDEFYNAMYNGLSSMQTRLVNGLNIQNKNNPDVQINVRQLRNGKITLPSFSYDEVSKYFSLRCRMSSRSAIYWYYLLGYLQNNGYTIYTFTQIDQSTDENTNSINPHGKHIIIRQKTGTYDLEVHSKMDACEPIIISNIGISDMKSVIDRVYTHIYPSFTHSDNSSEEEYSQDFEEYSQDFEECMTDKVKYNHTSLVHFILVILTAVFIYEYLLFNCPGSLDVLRDHIVRNALHMQTVPDKYLNYFQMGIEQLNNLLISNHQANV